MGPRQAQEGAGAHPATRAQWGQNPSNEGAGPLVDLLGHRFGKTKQALGSLGRAFCRLPGHHGWGWC